MKNISYVEPIALRALAEEKGSAAAAAKLLGYSPSSISTALSSGRVRETVELAAKGVLAKEETLTVFTILTTVEQAAALRPILKALGITYQELSL